jgi:hypothetical protein
MKLAVATLALLCVCGCGNSVGTGGPGGDSDLSSAPGEIALVNYLEAVHRYTLNATDGSGNSYTIDFASQPSGTTSTFAAEAPAYGTVSTLTLQLNGGFGGTVENTVSTFFYLLSPYVPLGKSFSNGTPYGVVTSSANLPTTFEVGASGPVYSLTYYHDATMSIVDSYETVTYSVEPYDATTLHVCLSYVLSDVTLVGGSDGLVPGQQEVDCYAVDAAGQAELFSIDLMVSAGETLTFT